MDQDGLYSKDTGNLASVLPPRTPKTRQPRSLDEVLNPTLLHGDVRTRASLKNNHEPLSVRV